ncbi:hypothetical protein AB0I22_32005, partial [Streptomyces sp. NPDC050610]|uniref:hypothetical protein n=1 Tax=Streptomyces sp. NPDC050610 TaxID=3157097 RepID=UPI0034488642
FAGAFRPFGFFAFPTLPDPFSVPFPVGILSPVPVGGGLPFGGFDFIRFVSAELIGFVFPDKDSKVLRRN